MMIYNRLLFETLCSILSRTLDRISFSTSREHLAFPPFSFCTTIRPLGPSRREPVRREREAERTELVLVLSVICHLDFSVVLSHLTTVLSFLPLAIYLGFFFFGGGGVRVKYVLYVYGTVVALTLRITEKKTTRIPTTISLLSSPFSRRVNKYFKCNDTKNDMMFGSDAYI